MLQAVAAAAVTLAQDNPEHFSKLTAIILAIVEGLTEFLPISSTGHMILAQGLLKIPGTSFAKVYLINIQFGAILSVLVLYFRRFFSFRSPDFYFKIAIAFIPAAVLGFLLNKQIDALLESVTTVAISLIVGGIVIIVTDRIYRDRIVEPAPDTIKADDGEVVIVDKLPPIHLTYIQSFIVGCYQTIAMIPGVSRSAVTIVGGLTQGLKMYEAAEFSFFLSVPTIAAAALYKTYKGFDAIRGTDMENLLIGNVVAFIVAMIAIKYFIGFISKFGMKLFGYYRIILGIIILVSIYVFHMPLDIIK